MDRLDWIFIFAIALFISVAAINQDWTTLIIPLCFTVLYGIIKVAEEE